MSMKTLLLASALGLAALSPAKAEANKFPAEMLGSWCVVDGPPSDTTPYVRKSGCVEDGKLIVSPISFTAGNDLYCKFTSKKPIRPTKLAASYGFTAKCDGDGRKFTWKGRIEYRSDDTLFLTRITPEMG